MDEKELIPHLFRNEFRKISSVLCKRFGLENIELAEDISSETFLAALESWPYKGIPENPTAWLYAVAKNKAKNHLSRHQLFNKKITADLKHSVELSAIPEIDLSEKNITDSQLQMLFAICHPSIPLEAQVSLSLRILCGFGIEEIATALLSNKETISKRLLRAKEKLRAREISIEFPLSPEINMRLDAVLTTIYLLFSEGYYSESNDNILRRDLCLEAMRLTNLLAENEQTNKPEVNALLSLMCFHASRLDARTNDNGEMILYEDQDETLWNRELIVKGIELLNRSSQGEKISKYHVEANIAYWHTIKEDNSEKWQTVLHLYNQLLIMQYSPIAALNRTYALSKVKGKEAAIKEAEKLNLATNHFYFTLLGELYKGIDDSIAKEHFKKALSLARTQTDKLTIQKKIMDF